MSAALVELPTRFQTPDWQIPHLTQIANALKQEYAVFAPAVTAHDVDVNGYELSGEFVRRASTGL